MEQESFTLEGIEPEVLISKFLGNFTPAFSFINFNETTRVFIIERFYFRVSSNLSAIVIFDFKNENNCLINMIASGGATGLFQIKWGSEKSMLKELRNFFSRLTIEKK
jgi:hypothetical protein